MRRPERKTGGRLGKIAFIFTVFVFEEHSSIALTSFLSARYSLYIKERRPSLHQLTRINSDRMNSGCHGLHIGRIIGEFIFFFFFVSFGMYCFHDSEVTVLGERTERIT